MIEKVNSKNIDILYELNYELATDEGQQSLFTATRNAYADAFLNDHPILMGYLLYSDGQAIGFYIYSYKFASYLGSKVIYIEDIHLTEKHRNLANKKRLLEHAIQLSVAEKCCRVELRVLKSFNIGYELIESFGFNPVSKWQVYRLENSNNKQI